MEHEHFLPAYSAVMMMIPNNDVPQEEEREQEGEQEQEEEHEQEEVVVQEEDDDEEEALPQQQDPPPASFIHTSLLHCPPTKVDVIGRVQIQDYVPRTIEEPGCVSDQFYRRVLKKKFTKDRELSAPSTSAAASASASPTTEQRGLDSRDSTTDTEYYTYPDYPSEEELSFETKPHQILDIGRWMERANFEEHILMDFVREAFSFSLSEEIVDMAPIVTTWNIHSMDACDTTTEEHYEEEYHETKRVDESSSSQGTLKQEVIRDSSNNDAILLSNTQDDSVSACISRKRTDSQTTGTAALSDSFDSEATPSRNSNDNLASSLTSSSPDDSFHEAIRQFAGASDSDAYSDETERQAAAAAAAETASSQPSSSRFFCGSPCCAWKRHCSINWIKYGMEFVITLQRTLKPDIPPARRQQLLRMMRDVALEKYGLTSVLDKDIKTSDSLVTGFTTSDGTPSTKSKTNTISGCMRYELLESDYDEASTDVLEISTWRSSYDYEMQQHKIKHTMPHIQRMIQNIDSYFEKDQDIICYWETLICE